MADKLKVEFRVSARDYQILLVYADTARKSMSHSSWERLRMSPAIRDTGLAHLLR